MATFVEDNVMRGYGGAADGLGGGGGILGLVALLALLNRNGLGGLGGDGAGVSGLNNLQGSIDSNAIMQQLSDIKASVPFNEAQVQLALAQAVSQLNAQATANTHALGGQVGSLSLQNVTLANGIERAVAAVDTNVDRSASVINQNILASENRLTTLITDNKIEDLQRQLTVAELRNTEERHRHDRERDRISIETTVNQNQMQSQLQQQQQQNRLDQLLGLVLDNTQIARATNQQLIIGNTGAVAGGPQNANPTNVRA